ncbi:hypothetical protein PF010_g25427 [Phytophthora fragariae]|uniref:Uncharacterized protein n=1 Tax=Phytophthora fragariae TaxID=53985 RepID=A0A6A3HVV3_9STRA|nr:hypothetical protein PF011_g24692 [Phytophthora fragariae]KAE9072585.1 hypothetical protein PF010_g25427 [Phytophthora fragariae]
MPCFAAAILEGYDTSKARVVNNLRRVENIDVSDKSAVLYRAIQRALVNLESDVEGEFEAIPSYLELFTQRKNVILVEILSVVIVY